MSSLLLKLSLDLRPSIQYSLVSVMPRCFRMVKICLCQVRRLSK
jgi:hypothetical protein